MIRRSIASKFRIECYEFGVPDAARSFICEILYITGSESILLISFMCRIDAGPQQQLLVATVTTESRRQRRIVRL